MSYNVTKWKTKELADLRIPVASLFKSGRTDWHPQRVNADGISRFSVMDGSFVEGEAFQDFGDSEWLKVTAIEARGEGSGTALDLIMEPALADSRGKLVATRIWEGGDYIDRLTVIDGEVKSEAVEL